MKFSFFTIFVRSRLLGMEKCEAKKVVLWNANFVKMCCGNFIIFFAFYLLLPLLPLYLKDVFNADKQLIGLILSGYTITALCMRLFSGYLVDNFPRKVVLMVCHFIFSLLFLGYFVTGSLLIFAIVRTLHGAPFGAVTVANSTVAIDVLYPERRAEGIGYYGLGNNIAMATAPIVAMFMYDAQLDFKYIFLTAFLVAMCGFLLVSTVKLACSSKGEASPEKPIQGELRAECSKRKREPLKFENFFLLNGWRPGLMLAFFALSYGILMNYLAIYGKEELGITGGTGAFYLVMAAGLILSRLVGGRNLRKGKLLVNVSEGIVLAMFGYLLFVGIKSFWAYYCAALLIGLGNGHLFPGLQTMFINLASHSMRGTANSTFLTSWDVGIGCGVILGGFLADNYGYETAFWGAFVANAVGVAYFFIKVRSAYERLKLR